MTTCETLPLFDCEPTASETSTPSAAASPARTFRSRAAVQVLTESAAAYGESSPVWLASFDPSSCSWRTSGLCLAEDLPLFSQTLPRSGMTRNGTLYLLPPLVQITYATGSGSRPLLPTLQAQDFRNCADYSDGSRGHSPQLRHLGKGRLNPSFCLWFMGFPANWTDVP